MEQYVVALDLGTSKIIGMIARKNPDGILSIQYVEKTDSETSIRRACVFNVDIVSKKVAELVRKLKSQSSGTLNATIEKIYIGIGGQGLHSELFTVKRAVENGHIDRELLESMEEEVRQHPDSSLIRTIFPPDYYVDGEIDLNPAGAAGSSIEAQYQLIVGRPLSNLKKAIEEKANVEVAGFFVSPLASAEAVLTEKEKETGCALVEIGAGVTYVSIYKGGKLKHLVTVPLGSAAITKDICSLDILPKKAEEFKLQYGSALAVSEEDDDPEQKPEDIEIKTLNKTIVARVEEILENAIEQINLSGYARTIGNIVITGGGASLSDLPESIRNKTGKEVRLATAKKSLVNQAAEWSQQPANSCVIGLLALGKGNCLKEKEKEFGNDSGRLFEDEKRGIGLSDDEQARKEQREKERKERERKEREQREKDRKEKERKEKERKEKGPTIFDLFSQKVEKIASNILNPDGTDEDDNNDDNKQ
jgi:cell division protein FtsA